MRAGELRYLVTIEEPMETQDAMGGSVKNWTPIPDGRVWAGKRDLSGRELYQAQQINAEITTEFEIRYRSDVDARMLVTLEEGQHYHVHAVMDPDGRRRRAMLLCSRSING